MASGAGLNRVFRTVLTLYPTVTAVSAPLTSYGTTGVNDTGMLFNEGMAFSKASFTMTPSDDYQVSIYYTTDKRAYDLWRYNLNPNPYLDQWKGVAPTLPANAWQLVIAPSEQAGTGVVANPIKLNAPSLTTSSTFLALRAAVTFVGAPSGSVNINVELIP